ncbi:MAG: C1 family peptidase [Bacteroidales bacterium]|nr:C1 family peptidase [Bacteroidales bacterium]
MKIFLRKKTVIVLMALFSFSFVFQSCESELLDEILDILSQTGWLEDQEEMDNIPEDITPFDDGGDTDFPSSFTLEEKFPPIGDQGQYGTCVAWSVGYNLKTALNAIEKGWTSSDLAKTSNQTSPQDLWLAIPSGKKGSNCNGTNFEPALDALISSGAASLSSVPYPTKLTCDGGTKKGDDKNKLANYRKIAAGAMKKSTANEGLTVDNFKGYLSAGRPVAIGAKLGDRFMSWNSSAIISSDTYNNPGMQHAYHAMALVGYDDNKNAFRVRNSWGTSWGDNGSIWVDYDFFCKNFCFAAFVAQNTNDISVGGGGIGGGDLTSGDDLLAFSAEDEPYEGERLCTYKVYNSGTTSISASCDWTVVYMYYNAVDANEYGIIYEDFYTDDYGGNKGDYGNLPEGVSIAMYGGFWNNVDVASGQLVAEEKFPDGTMVKYPKLTHLTGEYYLVVMVDAFDVIKEGNEDNNFYFITAANGKPLKFQNGEILNMPPPTKSSKIPMQFGNTESQTVVKSGNMNAYTPAEIRAMLLHDKKTGKLDTKMKAFRIGGGQGAVKVKK